jgi:dTDP-4-dehydrorhamnose 3,5-epimerase-like enzyme
MHKFIETNLIKDNRGTFTKLIDTVGNFKQIFVTESNPMVFRGFHFYAPKNESNRVLYVLEGCLVDILIDLRERSFAAVNELSLKQGDVVVLPKFCAHGFYTNTGCKLMYFFEKQHNSTFDMSINCLDLMDHFDPSKYSISVRDREAKNISTIKPLWD